MSGELEAYLQLKKKGSQKVGVTQDKRSKWR